MTSGGEADHPYLDCRSRVTRRSPEFYAIGGSAVQIVHAERDRRAGDFPSLFAFRNLRRSTGTGYPCVDQEIHCRLPHVKIGLECAQVIEGFGRGTLSYRPLVSEIGTAA